MKRSRLSSVIDSCEAIVLVLFLSTINEDSNVKISSVARSFSEEIRLSFVWENKNFIRKVEVFTDDKANKKLRITLHMWKWEYLSQRGAETPIF